MPRLGNTGKRRGFAYIAFSEDVVKELLKLQGIKFNCRKLVTEKAKTPPTKTSGKKASFSAKAVTTGNRF